MKYGKFFMFIISLNILFFVFSGATPAPAQEEIFLKTYSPDALVVLDLSGSMEWNPVGGTARYGNTSCSGTTFYYSPQTGYTTSCRRVDIAKKVIFNVLDETSNDTINSYDATALGVRFGYMRYRNCATSSEESEIVYGSNSSCEPDPINCYGAGCADGYCTTATTGTRYASSDCSTPDKINCGGTTCGRTDGFCNISIPTGTVTRYANTDCSTPDELNCAGTGCADGYCSTAISPTTFYAATNCSTPDPGHYNCESRLPTYNCGTTDGFCNISIPPRNYYANNSSCTPSTYHCRTQWSGCDGGFCDAPRSQGSRSCEYECTSNGCTQPCTYTGCNVGCPTTTGCEQTCASSCTEECTGGVTESWTSGCNTLVWPLESRYSCIYCRNLTGCASTVTSCSTTNNCTGSSNCVVGETATGGTHLAAALGFLSGGNPGALLIAGLGAGLLGVADPIKDSTREAVGHSGLQW